ncbi:hypothetical protein BKA62DRAFT_777326 [Auriculariales sp. MPI-PUGE-AT-0066]|nr:hypothetical protein BKA62DRAFT_777326 [Auriculariales sp. MPI-PUGE-AT-0066]
MAFEYDIMVWSKSCLEQNKWALKHAEENMHSMIEHGHSLPNHLHPQPPSRQDLEKKWLSWIPDGMTTLTGPDASVPEPLRGLSKGQFLKSLRIYHEEWCTLARKGNDPSEGDWYIYSNVSWWTRPPPNTIPQLHADCTWGVHDETLGPQWLVFGEFFLAFMDAVPRGQWQQLLHSRIAGDVAWYQLVTQDFIFVEPRDSAFDISHQSGGTYVTKYRLNARLVLAMRSTTEKLYNEVSYWNEKHPDAIAFIPRDFRMISQFVSYLETHELDEKTIRRSLADWQHAVRRVRGWVNQQKAWAEMKDILYFQRRMMAHQPSTRVQVNERFRGAHVIRHEDACALANHGVPYWRWVRVRGTQSPPTNMKPMEEVGIEFEPRLWDDAQSRTGATDQFSALRDQEIALRKSALRSEHVTTAKNSAILDMSITRHHLQDLRQGASFQQSRSFLGQSGGDHMDVDSAMHDEYTATASCHLAQKSEPNFARLPVGLAPGPGLVRQVTLVGLVRQATLVGLVPQLTLVGLVRQATLVGLVPQLTLVGLVRQATLVGLTLASLALHLTDIGHILAGLDLPFTELPHTDPGLPLGGHALLAVHLHLSPIGLALPFLAHLYPLRAAWRVTTTLRRATSTNRAAIQATSLATLQ